MKPFLHVILLNDNRHLMKTLYMYVLSRAADIAGAPTDGYKVLLNRFSQASFASKYNVKLVLEPLLEQFSEIDCSDDELDAHAKEAVASMEASINDAGNNHVKTRKTKKSDVAEEEDVAPSLVDVTDELEADEYNLDEEDDGYISLAEAFTPRKSNRKFGKHLKEIATLDTLRKYLLSSKQDKHHLLDKLNSPRLRRQMTLLSLHNIRLLNPDRRFKCARKLHRIMTITDTVQNMPSKRRSIDVAKALHNIKHAKPEKSIVRKRKSKVTEPKHVVFNLKNNQVATIPKKAKSTLTMPMWY
uniref:Nucleolar protein,Nop52 family protein n=1 Tax=Babesia bovis TaxID=5865 RepID=S6B3R7_BABBO|nr:nucleolar protein,Nop52 family protein [Babesia bovis]